ncbi:hypothetical protein POF50_007875 [Streptomyces sp. SL13]|uniref:Uncharacterized protein n=1 Tax=Streptantibioticus silvisoli TaxID=2705255 RepID=A0AA90GWP3_9ACTN|nr:hypothetical protein [Streptantibioticus silvisoli]MDI5969264.1 hypothetical protein [Streptantibioticus silvisoli]
MRRTVRLWRWRRNPLRRRSDVVEAWAGLAAGLVIVAGAPLTGIAAADSMHATLAAQNDGRHQVSAVLERDAPSSGSAPGGGSSPGVVRAPVRWTGHDGRTHSAHVVVAPGAGAGSRTPVWTDGRGRVTEPPLDRLETTVQTDVMGAAAAGGLCVAALVTHRGLRAGLDLRRSHRWQQEWARVGPRWSGRHA